MIMGRFCNLKKKQEEYNDLYESNIVLTTETSAKKTPPFFDKDRWNCFSDEVANI